MVLEGVLNGAAFVIILVLTAGCLLATIDGVRLLSEPNLLLLA